MTTSSNNMWGRDPYEIDYADPKQPVARAMYGMRGLFGEDDPHPEDKLAFGAEKTITSVLAPLNTIGRGNQDPFQSNASSFSDAFSNPAKPVQAISQSPQGALHKQDFGMNANSLNQKKPTGSFDLLEQTMNSVGAGDNALGHRTTEQYMKLNASPTYKGPVEFYNQSRRLDEEMLMPKKNTTAAEQALSSVASRTHGFGREYEAPMQKALIKSRGDVVEPYLAAQRDFTHKTLEEGGRAYGSMARENLGSAMESMHNVDTSFQKRWGDEDAEFYRELGRADFNPHHDSVAAARFAEFDGVEEDAENFLQGADLKMEEYKDKLDRMVFLSNIGLQNFDAEFVNPLEFVHRINENKLRIGAKKDALLDKDQIYVPEQPDKTLQNLRTWCYQSLFGRHMFDMAEVYVTRGWPKVATYAANMTDSIIDYYVDDVVNGGKGDFRKAIDRGALLGGNVAEFEANMNELSNHLDPASGLAWKFFIGQLSDDAKQKLFVEAKARQSARQE